MIINHNLNAMNAHRNMSSSTISQGKSMEKLSSGLRINRAGDDAAGLAISEKMRSQIRGLNQASRNSQDGISLIQTAEGALSETQAIGQRMRELAVQSANGTYTDEDRVLINQEFEQLKSEIDRIATDTEFSGRKMLNGDMSGKTLRSGPVRYYGNNANSSIVASDELKRRNESELIKFGEGTFEIRVNNDGKNIRFDLVDMQNFNDKIYVIDSVTIENTGKDEVFELGGATLQLNLAVFAGITGNDNRFELDNLVDKKEDGILLQVGANKGQTLGFDINWMRSRELGLGGVNLLTSEDSQDAMSYLDTAISRVSDERAKLGAVQNRLEHIVTSTDNTAENLQASESRIRDVDIAKEMMNLTKINVLQQASQAMLAQANQAPQNVLSILK